jgi:hypothetical protein
MSESTNCKFCNRSHMGGLSCFYGISRIDVKPISKSNPSKKKSSERKLLKNKYRRLKSLGESQNAGISFKQYIRNLTRVNDAKQKSRPVR